MQDMNVWHRLGQGITGVVVQAQQQMLRLVNKHTGCLAKDQYSKCCNNIGTCQNVLQGA